MDKQFMEINSIYEGDNIEVMNNFPKKSIDLIYLDPPFYTNKGFEIIWKDKAEIRAFQDRWAGGINHYITYMQPRLVECYNLLKDTGSIYLHCDPHANSYLREEMDKIFGENNFVNEIVWQRTNAHGGGRTGFSSIHDTILFYKKSDKFTFNRQFVPYSQNYIDDFFKYQERDGRRYRLGDSTGAGSVKEF